MINFGYTKLGSFLHKDDKVKSTKISLKHRQLLEKKILFSISILHNRSHPSLYVHLLTVQFLKIVTLRDSVLNDSLSLQDFISCSCMLAQILEQTGFWNLILRVALKKYATGLGHHIRNNEL